MKKRITALILCMSLVFSFICVEFPEVLIVEASDRPTETHYWWCRAHAEKEEDMYIALSADCSSSGYVSAYFSRSYAHWPNAFTYGDIVVAKTSARGTYTVYSSIITQWVSLAFCSYTETIYL